MHELSIATNLLDAVKAQMERRPGAKVRKVGVRVGELSAIDPEALRFSFEVLVRDTEFAGVVLEIDLCPRRHRCRDCSAEFTVRDYNVQCPQCGSSETKCFAGDELELAYLEIDEHEPSAVAAESSK